MMTDQMTDADVVCLIEGAFTPALRAVIGLSHVRSGWLVALV